MGAPLLALALLALLALAPAASADIVFGATEGPGAGQTANPSAIAADSEAGLLYVADTANNRVDVFKADGSFLRAFGWGVADGTTAALQTCTTTCFKGIGGSFSASPTGVVRDLNPSAGGAGEFSALEQIAVDNDPASPAHHDVYVTDGARVQRFSTDDNGTPANPDDDFAVFDCAWGGGVITAGAQGTGDLSAGSTTIQNVNTTSRRFLPGQTIVAAGKLPANTKIVGIGEGTIALSQPANAAGSAVNLNVAAGAGHVAVNEVKELVMEPNPGFSAFYPFEFETPNPSHTKAQTKTFTYAPATPAATIQAQLEELSNIDPGDVAVSGPAGGPYLIEFKGRYADQDVGQITNFGIGDFKKFIVKTIQNGASAAAVCTAANAADCSAGVPGRGPGQFARQLRIAVGPGGAVHIGDDRGIIGNTAVEEGLEPRLQAFDPSGAFTSELLGIQSFAGPVYDSAGDFYATGGEAVRKYDSAGNLLETIDPTPEGTNIQAIGLDAVGDLYIADSGKAETAVYEYDSTGNPLHTFYGNGTLKSRPLSLAPYSDATGDLFVLEGSNPRRIAHIAKEPPGPVVLPFDTKATNVSNLSATLKTRINPEGKSSTVHFQYVDDKSFKAEGGFASPKTIATPESASLGSDFTAHESSFAIPCAGPGKPGCLAADTVYHFRAVASNADRVDNGPEASFKTLPPITLGGVWTTNVGSDSAELHAKLDPNGIDAKLRFEYVDQASFNESGFATAQKTGTIDFGEGKAELAKSALAYPLDPDTTYRFRYMAEDFFGTFTGPEGTFATFAPNALPKEDCPNQAFRTGASANLPDCRAYELVSPLDKNNGDILAFPELTSYALGQAPARVDQATPQGDALSYGSYLSFGDAPSAPYGSQYIARRNPASGWSSHSVSPPREGRDLYGISYTFGAFSAFSEDLCSAWLLQDVDLALTPGAPAGVPNIYRRTNCGEEGYQLLSTVAPTEPAPGFGLGVGEANSGYFPTVQGFTPDGKISAFIAPAKLTPDASEADTYQAYLSDEEGALHLISVLPNGKAAKTFASVGTGQGPVSKHVFDSVKGALSADGSRVFWSAGTTEPPFPSRNAAGIAQGPSKLYLRINATQKQSKLSAGKCSEAAKACTVQIGTGTAIFRYANPQATKALYSEGEDLYELDVEKAIGYQAAASTLIAHKVKGLLGESEDATRVYLVSEEDLDGGGPASAGGFNLYLHEAGGGFAFVAALSGKGWSASPSPSNEAGASSDVRSISPFPINRSSRVSADGLHAAFMSDSLELAEETANYDNTDANSGEADSEVYIYGAEAGKLVCVSCNPSGARPLGGPLYVKGPSIKAWAAAQIPGWETQWHASRLLSPDGGRLYFESFEGLVPRDTNGRQDVYEWERAQSKEACLGEIGGELFEAGSEGCLSLISSGKSQKNAEFLDASASGSDVFFTTESSLLPQDYGLVDIYDAREGGGLPPPPGQPGACEGEACQSAPPPPNDPTPASAGFKGTGNPHEGTQARCAKGKARHHGRCVAKKHKRQHKRANHKRGAGR